MKRTLILAANAIPQVGGQGLNLHQVIEGLRESFEILLYSRGVSKSVNTHVVPPSSLATFISRWPVVRRLRDWQTYCEDVHFDYYVSQSIKAADVFHGAGGQCLRSLKAAKALGCRTAIDCLTTHIEDFVAHQDRECARFGIRPAISARLRRRTVEEYRHADLIRVLSEHARHTFLKRDFRGSQIVVARPPFHVREFPEATFQEPVFRISFVGLLEPWKGFHYLIEAYRALRQPDSELVLWGGPGSRAVSHYLREQTSRDPRIKVRPVAIRALGYGEVYGKSSVLVHPSLSEGFGYVVGEAMASGIPVIVTRNTGAADLVADGRSGYVVPAGDPEAIHERLAHLAAHPALLQGMGRAARQTMQSHDDELRGYYAGTLRNLVSQTEGRDRTLCPAACQH